MIIDQADFFGKEPRLSAWMSGPAGQDGPDFFRLSKMLNHLHDSGRVIVAF